MRKNKIMFMAMIFIVSLLCISAVSAADDADLSDVIADTDTNDATVLEESIDDASISDSQSDENVLSDDGGASEPITEPALQRNFTALSEDINNGGDTVYLEADYLFNNDGTTIQSNGIKIERPVTIFGNGHTIDGNGVSLIFNVRDSNVVFQDIIFKNGFENYSTASGAAIKGPATAINCTFIGNKVVGSSSIGGAMSDGTAINCTFINNTARYGGAIYRTTAENCTFIHNEAEYWGGAARESNTTNCLFLANNAGYSGGATYEGSARDCIYLSNNASANKDYDSTSNENCTFADSATLSVADFSTIINSGKKQMINLTGDGGDTLNNVPITVKLTKDGEEVGTYSGLSGDGWAVNLSLGNYTAEFSVDYATVEPVSCAIIVAFDTSFKYLDYLINEKYLNNSTIYLGDDYKYIEDSDFEFKEGIIINRTLTIEGNGHMINGSDLARIFKATQNAAVTFMNIIFANGNAGYGGYGGAIWAEDSTAKAVNCTFRNNNAYYGGAIANAEAQDCLFEFNKARFYGGAINNGNAVNCTFNSNEANYGGAIYESNAINSSFTGNYADTNGGAICDGNATGCIFESNKAERGAAIVIGDAIGCIFESNNASYYGGAVYEGNAINSTFTQNTAGKDGGAVYDGNATNSIFSLNTAEFGGAIYRGDAINSTFTQNTAGKDGGAVYGGNATNSIFSGNTAELGGAICGDTDYKEFSTVLNCTFNNNSAYFGGAIYLGNATNSSFTGNFIPQDAEASHDGAAICGDIDDNSNICQAVNCVFTNNNADGKKAIVLGIADTCYFNGDEVDEETVVVYKPVLNFFNFIHTYNDGSILYVNITTHSGMQINNASIKADVSTPTGTPVGTYNFTSGGWKVPLNGGTYVVTYNATDYDIDAIQGIIVVNKEKTTVTSKAVTAVYNNNKYLVITLKDSKGKAISGAKVTVTLASAKAYKTDKNGQIKINIGKLVPKTYTAKISFAGNTNYLASSTTAKVVVKKATPKMTAKAKTFKVKVKVKKYTITLKNNLKKVMKNTKVTLKVNKKTFTVKTNKKGVATFKITNLKKKGKFTAVIKYAGSKYYNKVTKKVKITVKK